MESKRDIGRRIMSEVLGPEYFARREASTSDFNMPIRVFSEEKCFGDLWNRPGLERKTRSLLLIGMLTALNRVTEMRFHVRSAINNGCTVSEIQEVLYQCITYCGLPAAVESFKAAEDVLTEMKLLPEPKKAKV
jgi:4-carboxymuconolactone decarboxylase